MRTTTVTLLIFLTYLFAPSLAAQTTQKKVTQEALKPKIDLIGIVPGISKKADVESIAHSNKYYCHPFCLEVGGYDLKCDAEYDQHETISLMTCWFSDGRPADNIEIFKVLKSGFSKKLGKLAMERKFQVKNALGAVYDVEDLRWRDQAGNTLEMQSRVNRIDQGALAIKSAAYIDLQRKEDERKKNDRKF